MEEKDYVPFHQRRYKRYSEVLDKIMSDFYVIKRERFPIESHTFVMHGDPATAEFDKDYEEMKNLILTKLLESSGAVTWAAQKPHCSSTQLFCAGVPPGQKYRYV